MNRPTTAHFIGGCPIGDSLTTAVVDSYQRLYGHPGLHVIDSSTITANLDVNPALTSPRCRSGRSRCGPTRANPTHVFPSAPLTSGFRRSGRAIRSCPKTRRRRFADQRSNSAANHHDEIICSTRLKPVDDESPWFSVEPCSSLPFPLCCTSAPVCSPTGRHSHLLITKRIGPAFPRA